MPSPHSVANDLREVFPGTAEHTLNSLLTEITNSTTSTGVLALLASLWLGSSFWGALDTAFGRIYSAPSRKWLEQKRFALSMLLVVLLFMIATVAVPTAQSILRGGVDDLPFDLAHVAGVVYVASLAIGVLLLFGCLTIIYSAGPEPPRAVARGVAGHADRDAGHRRHRLRLSALPIQHLDHRAVRDDDRVRADHARLVLCAGPDHAQRRDRKRAEAAPLTGVPRRIDERC